jgi:hypothetical protein
MALAPFMLSATRPAPMAGTAAYHPDVPARALHIAAVPDVAAPGHHGAGCATDQGQRA